MNRSGYITLAIISAIIALILLWYIRWRGGEYAGPSEIVPSPGYRSQEPGKVSCDMRLQNGARGEEVRILQGWINRNIEENKYRIQEDGIFGPKTESALRQVAIEVYGYAITSTSLEEIPELREHCA